MANWIKQNAISIIAATIALAGSYTTFQVNNALMLRDIDELKAELSELDDEFEEKALEYETRIRELHVQIAIASERASKALSLSR
jgi:benzoyl-CoA reductase/2-hydroxyglutaryl-CoA dehydratase subunit BcrC/BadD/HgdB